MRILGNEQGTQAWLDSRLGCPSGSGFDKLVTSTGKPSTSAEGYINQLIAEKLTGRSTEVKVTEWMQRGTELEPMARNFYELASGNDVQEVGFCKADNIEAGVSPDGLISDSGSLEIKCPSPAVHVSYLRGNKLPTKYIQQCQGVLWICEREWLDFVSYNELLPALIVRVHRDQDFIKALETEVTKACNLIEKEVARLKEM
jgi:hypothetical protein